MLASEQENKTESKVGSGHNARLQTGQRAARGYKALQCLNEEILHPC